MKYFSQLNVLFIFLSLEVRGLNIKSINNLFKKSVAILSTSSLILNVPQISYADNIVVFGGNGFVGSRVVKELVLGGNKVTSISKSGNLPKQFENEDWISKVNWEKGDPMLKDFGYVLKNSDAAVSCMGAIGLNQDNILKTVIFTLINNIFNL